MHAHTCVYEMDATAREAHLLACRWHPLRLLTMKMLRIILYILYAGNANTGVIVGTAVGVIGGITTISIMVLVAIIVVAKIKKRKLPTTKRGNY